MQLTQLNLLKQTRGRILKVLSVVCNTLRVRKRKCQDCFAENWGNQCTSWNVVFSRTPCHQIFPAIQKRGLLKSRRNFSVIQKCMREIQNQWWLRKAEEVQFAADSKNSKLFCQTIQEMYRQQYSIFSALKSKDGYTPLTQPEDIKAHWCEHYTEFLNCHPIVDESVLDLIEQGALIVSVDGTK